ncbi:MAG TPA: glucosaminidase domain-containing protein [Acidimicrobiales bacterium]|jgi:hypothetical protein|nr:glucosaminidase domain-containing protein [Acidimicrobiales bacterium]
MADGSLSIAGPNTLSRTTILNWWGNRSNGRLISNADITAVVDMYLSEGADQGIRGDVAFAQAIIETGYFTNNDTKINNFAGVGHYNNAPSGYAYASVEDGIRVHIQLLWKLIYGNNATLAHPPPAATRGPKVTNWGGPVPLTTWSALDGHWAVPGNGYGNQIVALWTAIGGGAPPKSGPVPAGPAITGTLPPPPQFNLPTPPEIIVPAIQPDWHASPRLEKLEMWNGSLDVDGTARHVIGGSVDLAHDRLSQFVFTCVDGDFAISGRFGKELGQGASFGSPTVQMTVAVVETANGQAGPETTVTLRPALSGWLARDKGPLTENGVSATDWLSHRVSEYNAKGPPALGGLAGAFMGQPTAKRATIQRTAPAGKPLQYESSWDVGKRLASEEGFFFFESMGAVWFGKPSWVAAQATRFDIGWGPLADTSRPHALSLSVPACRRSLDVLTGDTCVVTVPHDIGEQIRPGMVLTLTGVFGFNADYLVVRVRWTHDGFATAVEVTGWTIVDPEATNPGGLGAGAAQAATPATTPTSPPSAIVWPFDSKAPAQYQRVDQGWDLQGPPGGNIRAIAAGVLGRANRDPGGFGNDYPYVVLDQPVAGAPSDTVYYGHVHLDPVLVGTHVAAGQVIAKANITDPQNGSAAPAGWLEVGWARHATGAPVNAGSGVTAGGQFMHDLLIGAPVAS